MSTATEYARSPGTALRSIDAYVLPHLLEVSAGVHAVIRSILVAAHDVVQRGQELAVVERVVEGPQDHRRISIRAPASGLVMRSWAMTGDVVAASWPLLSMASTEDVLIVALFPLADAVRIHRGDSARVYPTTSTTGDPLAARIVAVAGSPDAGEPERVAAGRSVRVVLALQDAPARTTWPGTPVVVEIG